LSALFQQRPSYTARQKASQSSRHAWREKIKLVISGDKRLGNDTSHAGYGGVSCVQPLCGQSLEALPAIKSADFCPRSFSSALRIRPDKKPRRVFAGGENYSNRFFRRRVRRKNTPTRGNRPRNRGFSKGYRVPL